MIKKCLTFFILSIFFMLLGGCETLKGAAEGAAAGAKKDWVALQGIDNWIKKNLW